MIHIIHMIHLPQRIMIVPNTIVKSPYLKGDVFLQIHHVVIDPHTRDA